MTPDVLNGIPTARDLAWAETTLILHRPNRLSPAACITCGMVWPCVEAAVARATLGADPRSTARSSATSARTKTWRPAPGVEIPTYGVQSSEESTRELQDRLNEFVGMPPSRKVILPGRPAAPRRWITLHGIGWLVQLVVGIATLYLIVRGQR